MATEPADGGIVDLEPVQHAIVIMEEQEQMAQADRATEEMEAKTVELVEAVKQLKAQRARCAARRTKPASLQP